MKKSAVQVNKKYILMVFFIGLIIAFILVFHIKNYTQAGSSDNVSGWAWNDILGWVSFNCTNPPNSCINFDYGVNVEPNGNLTGYAWSEVVGYIWFDAPGLYPGLPNNSAQKNLGTGEVSGWARICSLADDPGNCINGNVGWIKMRCYDTECSASSYGVYVDGSNEFRDYAWSDDFGWISFNCVDSDVCGTSNYKVIESGSTGYAWGWAWSEYLGWLSFNSLDCDQNANGFIDIACGGDDTTDTVYNYGVKVDPATYTFSGYAWSEHLGWVSFAENDPPDFIFSSECEEPTACDEASDNCTACLSSVDSKIYGWAKILILEDDGWLRWDDDNLVDTKDYGVMVDENGIFSGWAWNGGVSDGQIGWLSTNCSDSGAGGCLNPYSIQVTGIAPAKPVITSIIPVSGFRCTGLVINWNDVLKEQKDHVYRHTSSPVPVDLSHQVSPPAGLIADVVSFNDIGLNKNTTYYYIVEAIGIGQSESDESQGKTLELCQIDSDGLTVQGQCPNSVIVGWPEELPADQYELKRCDKFNDCTQSVNFTIINGGDCGQPDALGHCSAGICTCTDDTVSTSPDETHHRFVYQVRAINTLIPEIGDWSDSSPQVQPCVKIRDWLEIK